MNHKIMDRNMRYLVIEIFWAAIFTGCVSFNSAYLLRLGGSNLLLSFLTSGAALVNALATMPFAALVERTSNRRRLIIGSLAAFRLCHIALIVVPWFTGFRPEVMVAAVLMLNLPVALFNAGWLPLQADMIPIQRRARIFSQRNITLGITVTATTFLLGRWLDIAPFPFNYQLMYALAVVTSCLSTVYVARLVMPQTTSLAARAARPQFNLRLLYEVLGKHRSFTNIVFNTLIFNLAAWMAAPLQTIYFVRTLNASDGWLGLWLGLVSGGAVIGNLLWSRQINRHGAQSTLLIAALLSAAYFFLIGSFPNLTLILIFSLLAGMVNPGVDLSHVNVLFEVCPTERRATYMGAYVTAMNIGAFAAPLVVAPLVDLFGVQMMVLVLGCMRLLGASLFFFNPVSARRPQVAKRAG